MNQDMVPPYQTIDVLANVSKDVKSIQYTYINDYGGNTETPVVYLK